MFHFKKRKFVKNSTNENHFEKYIAEATNATCSTDLKNAYLHTVNTLKNTLEHCEVTKSVVGLDNEGHPIFWDMAKGNLLAAASMGTAIDYLSCCLPIFSMTMCFSPNEFQFFYLSDDCYSLAAMFPEYCRGEACHFTKNKNEICGRIVDELQYRSRLEKNELEKKPFLLIVIGNPYRSTAGAEKHLIDKMLDILMTSAQRLRCSFMMMTRHFEEDPYYCYYQGRFKYVLLGHCDERHSLEFLGNCDASKKEVMRDAYPWEKAFREKDKSPWFYGLKCFLLNGDEKQLIYTPYLEIAEYLNSTVETSKGEAAE
jgi:hypothetical protein